MYNWQMIKKALLVICLFLGLTRGVWAQEEDIPFRIEESLEARVVEIIEEGEVIIFDQAQNYQKLRLEFTKGTLKGERREIEVGMTPMVQVVEYKLNDKVAVVRQKDLNGEEMLTIIDFVRRDALALLFIVFLIITLLVAKKRGFTSVISMIITFVVIFLFILPRILNGGNPVLITIMGALGIIPFSFYLSHGNNKKTTVAILSTIISFIITGLLALIFAQLTRLTGLASEEAGMLMSIKQGEIDMKGLLLAGILIGTLGILDDITISQAAIVEQLAQASEGIKFKELYTRAMRVGEDHIASMINTLVLVYAGASLPLLLIFINNPHPISEVISYEFIAEEVVRTLVGSIGLIAAVPISTLLACLVIRKRAFARIGNEIQGK